MADRLIQVIAFEDVPASGTVALPHAINVGGTAMIPDFVATDTPGFTVSVDAAEVTVTNDGSAEASVNVWLELKHSIQRAFGAAQTTSLTPRPFVASSGGSGGGGGGGSGVVVWTVAKTWAEVYAEIQAMDGPKIVLVEYDENASNGRRITVNDDSSPTDINDCYFWAFFGARQGTGESTDSFVRVTFNDGVVLAGHDYGSGFISARLRSRDIYWKSFSELPLYSGQGSGGVGTMVLDIDGGYIEHDGTPSAMFDGAMACRMRNGAKISGLGGAGTGVFRVRPASGSYLVDLRSRATLGPNVFVNPDGAGPNSIVDFTLDSTSEYVEPVNDPSGTFGPDMTVNFSFIMNAIKATGEQYTIAIDGSGALVATPF